MKFRTVLAAVVLVTVASTASTCKSSSSKSSPKPSGTSHSAAPATAGKNSESSTSPSTSTPSGLGSGTLIVGKDIQPGTYKALASSFLGYWEREKDASGNVDSILANDNVNQGDQAVVTIAATDYAFKSSGFSGWVPASGPSLTGGKLGSGTLIVGKDIQPGTYKATATGINGYWARMKDTSGGVESILANDNVNSGEQAVVTISPSDAAFKSTGFTEWTKVS